VPGYPGSLTSYRRDSSSNGTPLNSYGGISHGWSNIMLLTKGIYYTLYGKIQFMIWGFMMNRSLKFGDYYYC
jgi:hypothetical protein